MARRPGAEQLVPWGWMLCPLERRPVTRGATSCDPEVSGERPMGLASAVRGATPSAPWGCGRCPYAPSLLIFRALGCEAGSAGRRPTLHGAQRLGPGGCVRGLGAIWAFVHCCANTGGARCVYLLRRRIDKGARNQ